MTWKRIKRIGTSQYDTLLVHIVCFDCRPMIQMQLCKYMYMLGQPYYEELGLHHDDIKLPKSTVISVLVTPENNLIVFV